MRHVLLPVLLLCLLALIIDVPAAVAVLMNAEWPWLLAGVVLVQWQILASAIRWRLTAQRLGQTITLRQAFREYYLATLINQTIPGGVTGDAARIVRNRGNVGMAATSRAVIIERLAGQLVLLLVVVCGVVAWPQLTGVNASSLTLRIIQAVAGFCLVISVVGTLVYRYGPHAVRQFMSSLVPAIRLAWFTDGVWLPQIVLSLGIVAGYIGLFAVCAIAIGQPLPLVGLLTVVPLALLSMLLPLSIGGWGVRETTATGLWPLVGLSPEVGLVTSILYGVLSLLGSLPGVLFSERIHR